LCCACGKKALQRIARPEGERPKESNRETPWQIRVPTSLTILQCGSACVEGDGLPCNCGPDTLLNLKPVDVQVDLTEE
jgi:hypothetical protein